mmetsp:Transcript_26461/g.46667  ORF Transcript_26461/g.46667 Transcript_26461/m.46667 type:complete len:286 (+) Transcript_26461:1102-1959(+)
MGAFTGERHLGDVHAAPQRSPALLLELRALIHAVPQLFVRVTGQLHGSLGVLQDLLDRRLHLPEQGILEVEDVDKGQNHEVVLLQGRLQHWPHGLRDDLLPSLAIPLARHHAHVQGAHGLEEGFDRILQLPKQGQALGAAVVVTLGFDELRAGLGLLSLRLCEVGDGSVQLLLQLLQLLLCVAQRLLRSQLLLLHLLFHLAGSLGLSLLVHQVLLSGVAPLCFRVPLHLLGIYLRLHGCKGLCHLLLFDTEPFCQIFDIPGQGVPRLQGRVELTSVPEVLRGGLL